MLSTLSPCVLPLLPLVVGSAVAAHRAGALALAAGLALSFTAIGLFVATVGFAIGLDGGVFRTASAVLLMAIGVVLLSGALQARFAAATGGVSDAGNRLLGPADAAAGCAASSRSAWCWARCGARASGPPWAPPRCWRRAGRTCRRSPS